MSTRSLLVIDPGHGGEQPAGASSPNRGRGPDGQLEKDVALDLALRTRDRLIGEHTVVLTRQADVNLSLADRAKVAQTLGATAFVSLHLSGQDRASDRTDAVVATSASPSSLALAEAIRGRVAQVTGAPGEVLRADLGQIAAERHDPATAACLVEIASLAPPARAAQLADPAYRDRLADALAQAIRDSVGAQPMATPQWNGSRMARSAAIVTPDVEYSITNLAGAAALWVDWLARYAQWSLGVPDGVLRTFPHAAICQLRLFDASDNVAYGTGFYIGDEVLLTCGHNFYDSDGWITRRVEVQPAFSPRMSVLPSQTYSLDGRTVVHPRWASAFDMTHDLAVLRVPGLPATAGAFRLANMSLSQDAGIVVCGYGKVDGTPFEEQGQRMDGAHISEADFEMVYYPINTVGGHSGSPVFHNDMVIGVHTGPRMRGSGTDPHQNRGVLLTPEKEDWIVSVSGGGVSLGRSASAEAVVAAAGLMFEVIQVATTTNGLEWRKSELRGKVIPGNSESKKAMAEGTYQQKRFTAHRTIQFPDIFFDDNVGADFEVTYEYNGKCVANVRMANTSYAPPAPLAGRGLAVDTNITQSFGQERDDVVAVEVEIVWQFRYGGGSAGTFTQRYVLFGDGRPELFTETRS